jgi:hypothetical protein
MVLRMSGLQVFNLYPRLWQASEFEHPIVIAAERTQDGLLQAVTALSGQRLKMTGFSGVAPLNRNADASPLYLPVSYLGHSSRPGIAGGWTVLASLRLLFVLNTCLDVAYGVFDGRLWRDLVLSRLDLAHSRALRSLALP